MKKIAFTILSLFILLAMASPAYGLQKCEFPVSEEPAGLYPCIVISRVGVKNPDDKVGDQDVWIPVGAPGMNMEKCKETEDELKSSEPTDYDDDKLYFSCHKQEEVAACDLGLIIPNVSNDRNYCSVGEVDGYDTALIFFQMEHVATRALSHRHKDRDLVAKNPDKVGAVINRSLPVSLSSGQQLVFTDGRAFFDQGSGCPGKDCNRFGSNIHSDYWVSPVVNDEIPDYQSPDDCSWINAFCEKHYYLYYTDWYGTVILPPKDEPTVPITVENLGSNEFALSFEGPEDVDAIFGGKAHDALTPRAFIRGWDVKLKSGRGFAKMQGDFDLSFARSRIEVRGENETVFSLTGGASLDFCGGDGRDSYDEIGLRVDLDSIFIPVFTFDDGAPSIDDFLAMTKCLEISYTGDADDKPPTPIRSYINQVELTTTCTVERICDANGPECFKCAEGGFPTPPAYTVSLYLVFKPQPKEYGDGYVFDIRLHNRPVHLADSEEAPAPIVYALAKLENGRIKHSGARIEYVFPDEDEDEDEDEEASSGFSLKPADEMRGKVEIGKDSTIEVGPIGSLEDNEDQDEDQDNPDGGSNGGSNTDPDLSTDDDSGSGDPDPVVCPEGETLVFGSCIPDLDSDQTESKDEYNIGLKSGCSLIATHTAPSWAPLVLVIFALLGLGLYRKFKAYRA